MPQRGLPWQGRKICMRAILEHERFAHILEEQFIDVRPTAAARRQSACGLHEYSTADLCGDDRVLNLFVCFQAGLAAPPSIADIWKVWRAQEAGIHSVEVEWSQALILSARLLSESTSSRETTDSSFQEGDVVTPEFPCRLTIAGDRVRSEGSIPSFARNDRGDLDRSIRAFDGRTEQSLTAIAERTSGSSIGGIKEVTATREWSSLQSYPILFAIRPTRIERFADPKNWWIEHKQVDVDGWPCIELRSRLPGGDPALQMTVAVLVDYASPHVIRRFLEVIRDAAVTQLDLHYDPQGDPPWLPTHWEYSTFFRDGELRQGGTGRLVSVSLNLEVPDETFHIQFPAGAVVQDGRRGGNRFIVAADGNMVPFVSGSPRQSGWNRYLLLLALGIGLAGAVWWWKRRSLA